MSASNEQLFNLEVFIGVEDGDKQELQETTLQLLDELRYFDIESADLIAIGQAPQGSKVVDPVILGAIAVAVGPMVLTKILEFIHIWSLRREGRRIKIKIQTDASTSLEIDVPGVMSPVEVKNWIDTLSKTINTKRQR